MTIERISAKLCRENPGRMLFWCPGCGEMHVIRVEGEDAWDWNKNAVAPTFSPSVLVTGIQPLTDAEYERIMAGEKIKPREYRCHSFVRDGRIQFLPDCTHALRGQTVDLPDIPAEALA